jgi:quinol monooxygenase YgiN
VSVTIIYNFQPAEGEGDALVELLKAGYDLTRAAPECEAVDVYQGVDEPHDVVMIEQWSSREAHQEHFAAAIQGSPLFERLVTLLVEPPQPIYLSRRTA